MKKIVTEFKDFIPRNVMDMAVGVIVGGAFGKITSYNNNYGLRRGSQPRLFPSQSRSC